MFRPETFLDLLQTWVKIARVPYSSSGQNDSTQFVQERLPKFNGWTSTVSLTDSEPCVKINLHGELLMTQANSALRARNQRLRCSSRMADGECLLAECPLWVADITYLRLKAEFVYLAVILDAFSRKVVHSIAPVVPKRPQSVAILHQQNRRAK